MGGGQHEHLFECGNAVAHAVEGYHAQCFHALTDVDFAQFAGVGAADDELADFIGHSHRFDDGETAGIARIFAAVAAASAIEGHALEHGRVDIQILEHLFRVIHRLFAVRTDAPHEALRAGENHGGGNQE